MLLTIKILFDPIFDCMEPALNNSLIKTLTVARITESVPGFSIFEFEEDAASRIHYAAGQYLTFIYYFNGIKTIQSYSITSSPALNEPLAVGIKRIANGLFSRFMTDFAGSDYIITVSYPDTILKTAKKMAFRCFIVAKLVNAATVPCVARKAGYGYVTMQY